MVFSPHPDDETLGAGGLIQRVLEIGGVVKVVFMTSGDGFPEGVEMEEHISHPTARDFRHYGRERQEEAVRVLETLGMKEKDILFLGFPDGGLCSILSKYRSDDGPDYKSPFTLEDRPPSADVILPNMEYNAEDLQRVITQVLIDFRPTLLVTTHPRDQHPDHHSTYFFVARTLKVLEKQNPNWKPLVLTFLVHFGQWPLDGGGGTGSRLYPPQGFPEKEGEWISFPLSPQEVETERRALLQYHTQMLVMGRYLLSFARANELFSFERQRTEKEIEELRPCRQ
jgi:LmbE family N-acetylglucosaminyl deacetylase